MSTENQTPQLESEFSFETSLAQVQDILDQFIDTARVEAVYGQPVQNGDTIMVPAAEVLCGMGFGMGSGYAHGDDRGEGEQNSGEGKGGGGGGGGHTFARPVAVIIAEPAGVRVEPILDVTKIALAALTAAGFIVGMVARMSRGNPE